MRLTVVGCGDAFGSGGRLQTCYHVENGPTRFLIDCGATAMIGLNRLQIDPNSIDTIFISHLHGDHFAGLVWWLIHAKHVAKRTSPLTVVGPAGSRGALRGGGRGAVSGLDGRAATLRSALSGAAAWADDRGRRRAGDAVRGQPSLWGPSYALRFEIGSKVLAFSGDSEWVDSLVDAGRGADLFIVECYQFDGVPRFHMSWKKIETQLDRIGAKRVMLTHMATDMLAGRARCAIRAACWPKTDWCSRYDGLRAAARRAWCARSAPAASARCALGTLRCRMSRAGAAASTTARLCICSQAPGRACTPRARLHRPVRRSPARLAGCQQRGVLRPAPRGHRADGFCFPGP
jgi:ribonuclease BN (tRNA processing enzyme)